MISLEAFSFRHAGSQGREIRDLVRSQDGWLAEAQPGTVHRYGRDRWHASFHVGRLSMSEIMRAFIVRNLETPVGLATIMFDQSVVHPEVGRVAGNDLDYWLAPGVPAGAHTEAARLLIGKNMAVEAERSQAVNMTVSEDGLALGHAMHVPARRPNEAFATIAQDDVNPAIGFAFTMDWVGALAPVTTDRPSPYFDVTRGGVALQVYRQAA